MDENLDPKYWYALKVFYNRVFLFESLLSKDGVECYIPCRHFEITDKNGCKRKIRETIVPSLMFFRSTEQYAWDLQRKFMGRIILYTQKETPNIKRPAVISDHEMQIFMLVTSAGDVGLKSVPEEILDYKVGQKVRISGGDFKGVEGYIQRIKHNRHLLVALEGICVVATSYIQSQFIEKIE